MEKNYTNESKNDEKEKENNGGKTDKEDSTFMSWSTTMLEKNKI